MVTNTKVTIRDVLKAKGKRKLVCATAYDYPQGKALDQGGVDIILVGDSLGMVVLGYPNTLSVTLSDMLHHLKAVRRGVQRALLVVDLPYLSFHIDPKETVRKAGKLVQEGGAEAVKLEGGKKREDHIKALLDAEIPVMGHIGLTPQSIHCFGGYRVQGKEEEAQTKLLEESQYLEYLGVFSIVLEGIPHTLGKKITQTLAIPTIGIGAGPDCDGQILVFHDLMGWSEEPLPKFVRPFAQLNQYIQEGIARYKEAVRSGDFPSLKESYGGA